MVEMIKPIGRPKKEAKQNVLPYTETCAITIPCYLTPNLAVEG
jgi:hypothetical protein